jgi:alpha-amylase
MRSTPVVRAAARVAIRIAALVAATGLAGNQRAFAEDVSAPAIFQDFENSYGTIENRMADIFNAGYGGTYTPPPGRADSGNSSVGYDQYNRFDLGGPGNPTLYGTETGLKTMIQAVHTMGGNAYIDLVWNHSGFSNTSTAGFSAAGGYPGFAITLQSTNPGAPGYNTQGINDVDGDYHSAFDTSTTGMRLSGLIDIAQEKNYQFIRNPVNAADPRNLPAGTTPAFGRLANVADPNNARFYPDKSQQPIMVFDPTTGEQNIAIYPFNPNNPMSGTAVPENAQGYLMRNAQWLVQTIGADGFRVDAAKNMPPSVLNSLDRAVYRSSFRTLLNGQQQQIFSFSEVYDGDQNLLQQYVRKDINPANPGQIGGNRDVLDFPLFFAMQSNLSGNGLNNNWNNVVNASIDLHDDGKHNGSEGVTFVSSHDNGPPTLDSVGYAYTLMMPGNTLVYFNGHEFGANRSFPQNGREDALGGAYGNAIPTLVDLRNRYGRGNYRQDFLEKENFAFERQGAALVMLSNRTDAGYDSRTIDVSFAPGTPLIELTGNAHSPISDPHGDIPPLLVVNADASSPTGASVNCRFLRNSTFNLQGNSVFTGNGYLVYGLPTPQGNLSLTSVSQVLKGTTPSNSNSDTLNYLNGTTRLSDISVVTANSFQVQLHTTAMTIPGYGRDFPADGDNALLKLDGGLDVNNNGGVDFTTPGAVTYGFEQFATTHSPGFGSADGNGSYAQNIDTTKLSEGMHYLDVIAFRHRTDGGPAVYSDWRQAIYVDRLPPNSGIDSFKPAVQGVNENQTLTVRSLDKTANSVHVFLDLPAALDVSHVLALVANHTPATQVDRDLFTQAFNGLTSGNHVMTIVSYEMDGNYNVQRIPQNQFAGLGTSTIFGAGLGDVNFDGKYTPSDISLFQTLYNSNNTMFNPAADLNGDGIIGFADVQLLGQRLHDVNADAATFAAYNSFLQSIPEPSAGFAVALLGAGLWQRRSSARLPLPRTRGRGLG